MPLETDADVRRLLDDHAWFRGAAGLEKGGGAKGAPGETLLEIARRLDDHIRFEERRFFERVQEALPEPDLAELAARSAAFRARWRRPRAPS